MSLYAGGMTNYPGFGGLLAALSDRKSLDAGALARRAGVLEAELEGVLAGVMPSPSLLRRLGPALGLHAVDVCVIGGGDDSRRPRAPGRGRPEMGPPCRGTHRRPSAGGER